MRQHDIILIANEPWENAVWRRRHHVAWTLSKSHKVLFVEPPFTVFSFLKYRSVSWKQLFNLGRLKYQGRNLYSYSPFKLLPLSLPFAKKLNLDSINKKNMFHQLKRFAKKLNIENPILWVFFSDRQYDYYGLLNENITVADLYDKFTTPTWDGMQPENIENLRQLQNKTIKNADIVFTVSLPLYDELKLLHSRVNLVPNGVDYESFQNINNSNGDNKLLKKIKKPVLGFLGMLHYKVDFALLDYIAENHQEWTLLVMGRDNIHVDKDREVFNTLKSRKNVIWRGEIERSEIPGFLGMTDVCLVPLKRLEMNRYANFLKVWEYFAAGKPVVAVDQGVDYEYKDHIRLAGSKEDFVKKIVEAIEKDTGEEQVQKRKSVAKDNTWDSRVKIMMQAVEESIGDKYGNR